MANLNKLLGIAYLVGKIKFKLYLQGPKWLFCKHYFSLFLGEKKQGNNSRIPQRWIRGTVSTGWCQPFWYHGTVVPNLPPKNTSSTYGCFQKLGVPQNGWFIMENPIKMDDLGVPLFSGTSICIGSESVLSPKKPTEGSRGVQRPPSLTFLPEERQRRPQCHPLKRSTKMWRQGGLLFSTL